MADWDPEAYGRVNTLQEYVAREALSALQMRGDERVLDVGCGDGRVTEMVVDRLTAGSLVGVDPSEAMVDAARACFAQQPSVEFTVGTAATLPYRDKFDLVTSFNALHWEVDWTEALARIRAALRTGGHAFLVFVCGGARPSIEDVVTEIAHRARWERWFNDFAAPFVHVDPELYAQAAADSGFVVEHQSVGDLTWDFDRREAFAAWAAAGTGAWTSRLPAEERSAFVDETVTAYAQVSGSDTVLRFLQCRIGLRSGSQQVTPSSGT